MIYDSNLFSLNTPLSVKQSLNNPVGVFTIENYCKELGISSVTGNVNKAKIFPINIMHFLNFVELFSPKDFITPEIKNRINSKKAKLVLNHSHESTHLYANPHYKKYWNNLLNKIISYGIDLEQVVFVSGDTAIEDTFKKNNNNFNVLGIDSFEFIYYYWGDHNIDTVKKYNLTKKLDFLFLNSVPREHRCVLKYILNKNNFLNQSMHSWLIGSRKPQFNDIDRFIRESNLNIDASEVYNLCKLEIKIDCNAEDLRGQGKQNKISNEWLKNTNFSLITETTYGPEVLFVTEKTYKTFLYGHPFMIYGNTNILTYLKNVGYETFPELFDETYDNISENYKIKKIIQNIETYKDRAAGKEKIILEKLAHNRNLFLTQPCRTKTREKLLTLFN